MKRHFIKKNSIERQYQSHPSFSDRLPWLEWSDEKDIVLLEDGKSVGALLEIKDISCEAKPKAFIENLHHSITKMFSTIVPLEADNPWVIQIYIQDELSLKGLEKQLENYTKKRGHYDDAFTQHYLSLMREHNQLMTQSEGIFKDPLSDLPFCGKQRRIRLVVYRRYSQVKKEFAIDVVEELEHVIQKLISQFRQIGLHIEQSNGAAFYDWLVRWFNPHPQKTGGDIEKLLQLFPYPNKKPDQSISKKNHSNFASNNRVELLNCRHGDKRRATGVDMQSMRIARSADNKVYDSNVKGILGWSFTQNTFFGSVKSEAKNWVFDDLKHKVLVCRELQESIGIGVISRERDFGESSQYALFDKFSVGSIYTIQMVFESKNHVKKHLTKLGLLGTAHFVIPAEAGIQ